MTDTGSQTPDLKGIWEVVPCDTDTWKRKLVVKSVEATRVKWPLKAQVDWILSGPSFIYWLSYRYLLVPFQTCYSHRVYNPNLF